MSDPSSETPAGIAERLADALQTTLGVARFSSLDQLFALKTDPTLGLRRVTAGMTVRPALRVEEHQDLTPDVLLLDPFLGTVGLVHSLRAPSEPASVTADALSESIRQIIDGAAYFRQLCLLHAERTDRQAFTVELVIVFERAIREQGKIDVTGVLQTLTSDTGYLRALGINLLDEGADGGFPELKKAFPWLLKASRRWLGSSRVRRDDTGGPPATWSVSLQDYRHRGQRNYVFEPGQFHVMHGYNGSGKSTLSEALELLLTRAIERLERKRKTRYFPFVRHRPAAGSGSAAALDTPAKAMLNAGSVSGEVTIFPPNADQPEERKFTWYPNVAPLPSASSFRLDQRLMDYVIQASDGERASLFLRAYFPGDQPALEAEASARLAAEAALAKLPAAIRQSVESVSDRGAWLRETLAWTSTDPAVWQPRLQTAGMLQMIAPLLPVSVAQLRQLSSFDSLLLSTVQRWDSAPTTIVTIEEELEKLDHGIDTLRARIPALRRQLALATPILQRFNEWKAERSLESDLNLHETVDRWLELQALSDLVSKYHDVVATLDRARAKGWVPRPEHQAVFETVHESSERLEFLGKSREDLIHARDTARAHVRALSEQAPAAHEGAAAPAPAAAPLHITTEQAAALNEIGTWLTSLAVGPGAQPLEQQLKTAQRDNLATTRGKSTIGVPGGLGEAIAEAQAIDQACSALEAAAGTVAEAFRACRTAVDAYATLATHEQAALKTFFMRLAQRDEEGLALVDALNELLSLFKPAPWAYSGIRLRAIKREGDAPEQLALRRSDGDDSEAELLLNTAEMNTFTLALFLLCAPGLDNPVKLLVLDDPLQNMDELTVSSLARGLGKVMRIYPDGWRILALFHGEEDVYRMRDEVRTSVYRLPWIGPADARVDVRPVRAMGVQGTERIELQNLSQIVTLRGLMEPAG